MKERDLAAQQRVAEIAAQEAQALEETRHTESVKATPLFGMAYAAAFGVVGKARARSVPERFKAGVVEAWSIGREEVKKPAYHTARLVHKWIGLDWVEYVGEEIGFVVAFMELVDRALAKEDALALPNTKPTTPAATSENSGDIAASHSDPEPKADVADEAPATPESIAPFTEPDAAAPDPFATIETRADDGA